MTEKKLKQHLRRIWFHYDRLRVAINDAHNADVIADERDYNEEAPCAAMDIFRDRIYETTRAAISKTIHTAVRNNIK